MISVILPCCNEPRILETIKEIEKLNLVDEIIISSDRERNGKGWAIKQGLKLCNGNIIIFLDADMDIHPKEILNLIKHIKKYNVIIGAKDLSKLPLSRRIISFGYRVLVRMLFRLHISDTQTGLKIWRKKFIPEFENNDFSYDIEMIVKTKTKIKEVFINVTSSKKVTLRAIIYTFIGTMKVWIKFFRLSKS